MSDPLPNGFLSHMIRQMKIYNQVLIGIISMKFFFISFVCEFREESSNFQIN